ncbi:MAG: hypothetical protein QW461_08205 [Candidatus Jordarchaeales archaeon]
MQKARNKLQTAKNALMRLTITMKDIRCKNSGRILEGKAMTIGTRALP